MKAGKSSKKRKNRAARILVPLFALLTVALVAAALLYSRLSSGDFPPAAETETEPSVSIAPLSLPVAAPPEPTPEATPVQPRQLYLELVGEEESLDVYVCDTDWLAVPGYAFPLEIRYQGGNAYSVLSDVNGHYHASYIPSGTYTVTLQPPEGFLAPDSVSCAVKWRSDGESVGDIGSFGVTAQQGEGGNVEGLAGAMPPDGESYRYHYSVGENGYLLYADGTESDVLPVEERGDLAYGLRMVTRFHLPDGTDIDEEDLPADAMRWTDYYTDEKAVAVPLIFGGGAVDERYAITSEWVDPSSVRRTGWVEENGRSYYYAADGRPVSGLKNIEGKLYFFDGSGAKASALGIDVSYHNSFIDWNAVKAAGIDFAIIRVAYRTWEKGILNEDEDSYRQGKNGGFYLQGAKAAGLKVGVYVYSTAITAEEAVEEANKAIEIVRKAGVELDLPIYFDTEYSNVSPKGRSDKLNYIQRAAIAKAFCETVEKAGLQAGVYSYENFFNRALRLQDVDDYDIWYATYTRGYTLPTYRGFAIWQFTESGRVNGMPDEVDMNVIF